MTIDSTETETNRQTDYLIKVMPPLWWELYEGCVNEGFTKNQSLALVTAFVTTFSARGAS